MNQDSKYFKVSSENIIQEFQIPDLIQNTLNTPFISQNVNPIKVCAGNENDDYKEISKEIETYLGKNDNETQKDDQENILNHNNENKSIYCLDDKIWNIFQKENTSERSRNEESKEYQENFDTENKEILGLLKNNFLRIKENHEIIIENSESTPANKKENCFSIENIDFFNETKFLNNKNSSYLFSNATQENNTSEVRKLLLKDEDSNEKENFKINNEKNYFFNNPMNHPLIYDFDKINIDNFDEFINGNGKNFENNDLYFNMKNKPYEKNKFNINQHTNKNIFCNKSQLINNPSFKDKNPTNEDSSNLLRTISNGNSLKERKRVNDKSTSFYEYDEQFYKELTEFSIGENSNPEKPFTEKKFIPRNFHINIKNSYTPNKTNFQTSPEFLNFNLKNKNSSTDYTSPKSRTNSLENGQEKNLTDNILPYQSNLDLADMDQSEKNYLFITPNSIISFNPFSRNSNSNENGAEKSKEEGTVKENETNDLKKCILNNINNSFAYSKTSKYFMQAPFYPKNLTDQQQPMNYSNSNNFNYLSNYNYQFTNNFNGIFISNSLSPQNLFYYQPKFYNNNELKCIKGNISPILSCNDYIENNGSFKNWSFNFNQNEKNLENLNSPSKILQTNNINENHFNKNNNNFKINSTANLRSSQQLNISYAFDCFRDRDIKLKTNKISSLEEPNNKINLENILRGKDKRTTLMIRHIPNKYSIQTFLEDINQEFKVKYDLFYLPLDYYNNCNLGFAFINFVDAFHILYFFDLFRGKKWKRFNSEKICELAYAKFQGKKELIAHFERGSIMHFEAEDKKPLILPTPNPLPKIELPIKFYDSFIALYPYSSFDIGKDKFVINNFY